MTASILSSPLIHLSDRKMLKGGCWSWRRKLLKNYIKKLTRVEGKKYQRFQPLHCRKSILLIFSRYFIMTSFLLRPRPLPIRMHSTTNFDEKKWRHWSRITLLQKRSWKPLRLPLDLTKFSIWSTYFWLSWLLRTNTFRNWRVDLKKYDPKLCVSYLWPFFW